MKAQDRLEQRLYDSKWFDYRMMAPDTATLVFIHEWAKAYTGYKSDIGAGEHFQFLKNYKQFDISYLKTEKRRVWLAMQAHRQFADKRGLKYDDFWEFAFEFVQRRNYQRFFANIFYAEDLRAHICQRCEERYEIRLKKSNLADFQAANWRGNEIQNDYYNHLIRAIVAKYPGDYLAILGEMAKDGTIPLLFLKQNQYLKRLLTEARKAA